MDYLPFHWPPTASRDQKVKLEEEIINVLLTKCSPLAGKYKGHRYCCQIERCIRCALLPLQVFRSCLRSVESITDNFCCEPYDLVLTYPLYSIRLVLEYQSSNHENSSPTLYKVMVSLCLEVMNLGSQEQISVLHLIQPLVQSVCRRSRTHE